MGEVTQWMFPNYGRGLIADLAQSWESIDSGSCPIIGEA